MKGEDRWKVLVWMWRLWRGLGRLAMHSCSKNFYAESYWGRQWQIARRRVMLASRLRGVADGGAVLLEEAIANGNGAELQIVADCYGEELQIVALCLGGKQLQIARRLITVGWHQQKSDEKVEISIEQLRERKDVHRKVAEKRFH